MTQEQLVDTIKTVFFPYAKAELKRVQQDSDLRFAHYTSAEVALSIIRNGEMWLRNSTTMNDVSEVRHGLHCLADAYEEPAVDQLKWVLEQVHKDLQKDIEKLFNGHTPSFLSNTYLTCVSEHSLYKHPHGRLSMWRAYAPVNGVALILKTQVFGTSSDVLRAYSSPVRYGSTAEVSADLALVGKAMVDNLDFVKSLGRDVVYATIFHMLYWYVLCTKHPAFEEEKEWRVTHSPALHASDVIKSEIFSVRGVPQLVYKLPLRNFPDEGLTGLAIPEMLDHIIVGPSAYGQSIRDALVTALRGIGIENAHERVKYSDIPLRTG